MQIPTWDKDSNPESLRFGAFPVPSIDGKDHKISLERIQCKRPKRTRTSSIIWFVSHFPWRLFYSLAPRMGERYTCWRFLQPLTTHRHPLYLRNKKMSFWLDRSNFKNAERRMKFLDSTGFSRRRFFAMRNIWTLRF